MVKIPTKAIFALAGIFIGGVGATVIVNAGAAQRAINSANEESSETTSVIESEISSEPESSSALESIVDSSAPETSSEPVSSEPTAIESETQSAVSTIHEATDSGVSQIQEAASQAVQEVKQAMSEPTSSETRPTIHFENNKMTGNTSYKKHDGTYATWDIECETSLSLVDDANKTLIINYCGRFDGKWEDVAELKAYGFKLKNASGEDVDFEQEDFCRLKVPYTDLSDVSELYLTYGDQSIKITVS